MHNWEEYQKKSFSYFCWAFSPLGYFLPYYFSENVEKLKSLDFREDTSTYDLLL